MTSHSLPPTSGSGGSGSSTHDKLRHSARQWMRQLEEVVMTSTRSSSSNNTSSSETTMEEEAQSTPRRSLVTHRSRSAPAPTVSVAVTPASVASSASASLENAFRTMFGSCTTGVSGDAAVVPATSSAVTHRSAVVVAGQSGSTSASSESASASFDDASSSVSDPRKRGNTPVRVPPPSPPAMTLAPAGAGATPVYSVQRLGAPHERCTPSEHIYAQLFYDDQVRAAQAIPKSSSTMTRQWSPRLRNQCPPSPPPVVLEQRAKGSPLVPRRVFGDQEQRQTSAPTTTSGPPTALTATQLIPVPEVLNPSIATLPFMSPPQSQGLPTSSLLPKPFPVSSPACVAAHSLGSTDPLRLSPSLHLLSRSGGSAGHSAMLPIRSGELHVPSNAQNESFDDGVSAISAHTLEALAHHNNIARVPSSVTTQMQHHPRSDLTQQSKESSIFGNHLQVLPVVVEEDNLWRSRSPSHVHTTTVNGNQRSTHLIHSEMEADLSHPATLGATKSPFADSNHLVGMPRSRSGSSRISTHGSSASPGGATADRPGRPTTTRYSTPTKSPHCGGSGGHSHSTPTTHTTGTTASSSFQNLFSREEQKFWEQQEEEEEGHEVEANDIPSAERMMEPTFRRCVPLKESPRDSGLHRRLSRNRKRDGSVRSSKSLAQETTVSTSSIVSGRSTWSSLFGAGKSSSHHHPHDTIRFENFESHDMNKDHAPIVLLSDRSAIRNDHDRIESVLVGMNDVAFDGMEEI